MEAAWFTFRYAIAARKDIYSEFGVDNSVSLEYLSDLFEADMPFLRRTGLYASFVREYRTGSPRSWWQKLTSARVTLDLMGKRIMRLLRKYVMDDPLLWTREYWEGPSEPFDPRELRRWAVAWIDAIRSMNREQRVEALYESADMAAIIINELTQVIEFATRADRDRVKVTMQVTWQRAPL